MSSGSLVKTQRSISSHHHASVVPHQKLPVELLAEIFVQCMPSMEFGELTRDYDMGRDQVFEQGWMYPHLIRARLALVCQAWYTVLYNEPRVWTIMVLRDTLVAHPETVSLWIKKSKSMPLVVYIPDCRVELGPDNFLSMLRQEMWRIQCLFWDVFNQTDLSALFPFDVSTNAPMLQSLALLRTHGSLDFSTDLEWGDIHCPELRTLCLCWVNAETISLTVSPLKNVRHLSIVQYHAEEDDNGIWRFLTLLEALPNLVSLSWSCNSDFCTRVWVGPRSVVLRSLESLTLDVCCKGMMECVLDSLRVPSLERMVLILGDARSDINTDAMSHTLIQLRHLTLGNMRLWGSVPPLLGYLKHLETLIIEKYFDNVDELFIALSSHNHGSSILCPCLKTLDISDVVNLSRKQLVDFVQQRVKSDLDDPAPGLVTCLKLSYRADYIEEMCAQLVKTHSSSILFLD